MTVSAKAQSPERWPAKLPADWPHRDLSRVLRTGTVAWHVQVGGSGPTMLLLHGSGASAHSWADLLPALMRQATVVAPDLPGNGFTAGASGPSLSLTRIASELDLLLAALTPLGVAPPSLVVGHSAGAALALRWALTTKQPPRALIGFNPSLVPPPAAYTALLAPLLNPLATSAPMAALLARLSRGTGLVGKLLDSTRSTLSPLQRARYARLFSDPAHVRGTMGFMAAADLPSLLDTGHCLAMPLTFVVGEQDEWVPKRPLLRVIATSFPAAEVLPWPGGHLLHEATPDRAAALVLERLERLDRAVAG